MGAVRGALERRGEGDGEAGADGKSSSGYRNFNSWTTKPDTGETRGRDHLKAGASSLDWPK